MVRQIGTKKIRETILSVHIYKYIICHLFLEKSLSCRLVMDGLFTFQHSATTTVCYIFCTWNTTSFATNKKYISVHSPLLHTKWASEGLIFISNAEKICRDTKHTDRADQSVLIFLGRFYMTTPLLRYLYVFEPLLLSAIVLIGMKYELKQTMKLTT